MGSILLDINEVASSRLSISTKFTGLVRFRFRLKVAVAIMRLAGWISPIPIDVEVENEART